MREGPDLKKIDVAGDKAITKKDFWVNEHVPPKSVIEEFNSWYSKPIPEEVRYIDLKPNLCIFEVFAINVNKYKEEENKRIFEANKAAGIIPINQEYQSILYVKDSSGNINSEWTFFPIARVLKIGDSSADFNPLGIKNGDIVRLTDSLSYRAENPVYKEFISKHPYPNAIGLIQVTPTPQRFIYNMIEGNSGLARDAFNINPFTNRWYGFVFMKLVTEFNGILTGENVMKMLEIADTEIDFKW